MAEVTVKIEIEEDGTVLVGREPQSVDDAEDTGAGGAPAGGSAQAQAAALMGGGQQPQAAPAGLPGAAPSGQPGESEPSYMKPVGSIDEALAIARRILSQAQGGGQDAQMAQGFGGGGAPAMAGRRPGMGG